MRLRLEALVLVAMIVAVAGGAWLILGGGPAEGGGAGARPEEANLWVDPDSAAAGCERRVTPVPYEQAAPCKTLRAAWRRAEPGDRVLVRPGRYGGAGTELRARAGAAAPSVVIQAAKGGPVVLEELDLIGVAHLVLDGFRVEPDARITDNNDKVLDVGAFAHDITLQRITLDLEGSVRDGLGVSGGVKRFALRESELCCNAGNGSGAGGKLVQIQNAGDAFGTNTDIVLDGNRVHTNVQGTVQDHMECLYLAAVTQLTLSRNHFYDCTLNTIEGAFGSVPQVGWRIENNVFEYADRGVESVPLDLSACHTRSDWTVQYNFFAQGLDACDNTGVVVRGNVGRSGGCRPGAVYAYNVWADARCSATDVEEAAVATAAPFVLAKAPEELGAGDYRPSGPDAPQVGAGDPAHCPEVDLTGARRPQGARCDAGPYQLGD